MVVADEDVAKLWPSAPSFAWVYGNFCGTRRQVWVGCGIDGLVLACETSLGFDRSEISRMKKPWCQ
jgi:hypothetical protein